MKTAPSCSTLVVCATLVFLSGCVDPGLDTSYGLRYGQSVNGTGVLSDMLIARGHKVSSRKSLSPNLLENTDCIVWFPDDREAPTEEVRDWLEKWLTASPGRTLIYVGSTYDSEYSYWKAIEPSVPANQLQEVQKRAKDAKLSQGNMIGNLTEEDCEWFSTHKLQQAPQTIKSLSGPWSSGIDAGKCELETNIRFKFPSEDEVLLRADRNKFAVRAQYVDYGWPEGSPPSQMIMINNGSFLLNLPLVNHEHRKLAGHLMDEIPPQQRIVFLESGEGGPEILDSDPEIRAPNGLEIFSVWPIGIVLVHLAVAGMLFCFMSFPIFGVPRDPPAVSLSDFGKHVTALGAMLRRTRDRAYAASKIGHYRQTGKGQQQGKVQQANSPQKAIPSADIVKQQI
ncbi:MAG: hypothetical protein SGJ20_16260 [Planctomycetota bacterium]|nr:hypothetical protein [Planctomycetota bacterium]